MRFQFYSVFDSKAGVYLQPFLARSHTDACRNIAASFDHPDFKATPVATHPEDFDLCHLGTFDDETGHIQSVDFKKIANIAELRPART